MGNDGGSIPTRRELVKNAARTKTTAELKETTTESQTHAWTFCPLSLTALTTPIVSDTSGTLYNKDAILKFLLPQDDNVPASLIKEKENILGGRVKSLKDVVEVKFTVSKEGREEIRVCPITSKELGPNTKAVYLVPCGHAYSEVAVREVSADACVECAEPYAVENIIPILPLAKDNIERLKARAAKLQEEGLSHSLKKVGGKKRKKGAEKNEFEQGEAKKAKENVKTEKKAESGIKNAATASITNKVLEEQEARNKRQKFGLNDNLKSLFSSSGYQAQKGGDFLTRGYSMGKKT
ncbi:Rtf2 RING-finger-domain-containing protein [Calycina marina]|uniref:Rtf2 RING-finger-domain-containing protein n=1 Tax=Calycina marina TaxID=1763456 RepID=A0A9P7ZC49_9HELO|nr:Rtf2 RING-finger-domain-containing protein [Calycina marina]